MFEKSGRDIVETQSLNVTWYGKIDGMERWHQVSIECGLFYAVPGTLLEQSCLLGHHQSQSNTSKNKSTCSSGNCTVCFWVYILVCFIRSMYHATMYTLYYFVASDTGWYQGITYTTARDTTARGNTAVPLRTGTAVHVYIISFSFIEALFRFVDCFVTRTG